MGAQRAGGAVGVAGGNGLQDGAVLLHRHGDLLAVGQVGAAEQRQLLHQPAVQIDQLAVADEIDDAVVEGEVQRVVVVTAAGVVAVLHQPLHLLDHGAQLLQLVGRDALGQCTAGRFVDHGAQVVDLHGLVQRDAAHEHAAVLLQPHQAGFFEDAEGLADRPARHAQPLGQHGLGELGAGRQLTGQDQPLDLGLHGRGERMRLQQRDGALGGRRRVGHGWHGFRIRPDARCRCRGSQGLHAWHWTRQTADCQQSTKNIDIRSNAGTR